MKSVCVFCGSNPGRRPEYLTAARELGRVMADMNLGLIYGGASVGIMGAIADSILEAGGKAVGVMPKFLVEKEVSHKGLTDLHVVATMHERKRLMADLADGFIALPGGLGTLEELFEVLTWAQLGMHEKPCGLLNACGYFRQLMNFLDHVVGEGFLRAEHREMIRVDEHPEALLMKLESYRAPLVNKWLGYKN